MIAISLCRRYSRLCSDLDLCSLDSLAECRLQKDRHQIVKDHAQRATNAPDRELRLVSGCEVLAEFISVVRWCGTGAPLLPLLTSQLLVRSHRARVLQPRKIEEHSPPAIQTSSVRRHSMPKKHFSTYSTPSMRNEDAPKEENVNPPT